MAITIVMITTKWIYNILTRNKTYNILTRNKKDLKYKTFSKASADAPLVVSPMIISSTSSVLSSSSSKKEVPKGANNGSEVTKDVDNDSDNDNEVEIIEN